MSSRNIADNETLQVERLLRQNSIEVNCIFPTIEIALTAFPEIGRVVDLLAKEGFTPNVHVTFSEGSVANCTIQFRESSAQPAKTMDIHVKPGKPIPFEF